MDPITLTVLGGALGIAFAKVAEKLGEKLVELSLEPTLDIAKGKLLIGYETAKAEKELRDTVMAALDEMRAEIPDPYQRLNITNWVTGQNAETYQIMAATAVMMIDLDAKKVPEKLLNALHLDNDRRELLARFLLYLRKHLANTDSFSKLISYANDLDNRGELSELAHDVEEIAEDTQRIKTLLEQMAAQQGLTDNDPQALEEYLEYCRRRWSRLMLPLVRKNVGPLSPSLKRIFVRLMVRDDSAEEAARKKTERAQHVRTYLGEAQEQVHPVDFYEAFSKYKHFVLVGLPGTGKTTLLRRAAFAFAEGRAEKDIDWKGKHKLPIFVRLRNFGIFLAKNGEKFSAPGAGALVTYLEQHLRNDEGIEIPHDFFERRLLAGDCVILLDGLDEVLDNRVEVAQHVNAFIQKFGKYDNRIGISSRPKGYEGDARLQLSHADLPLLEVLPLQPDGIRSLIGKLLPLLETDPRQRAEDFARLGGRILTNRNLTDIASVPLFCSALVQVYKYHGAELPQRRVDVLAEIVDLLLGFWYAQNPEILEPEKLARSDGTTTQYADTQESIEQKFNRLAHLAYYMQEEIGQAEISSELAQKRLAVYLKEHEGIPEGEARKWARSFLRSAHEQSGLFVESNPDVYTFLHKNFMEYFAASSLHLDQEDPLATIISHLDDDWWEQVLLLAASHPKATNPFRRKVIPAILECAEGCNKGSTAWIRRLSMAGQMARDMTSRLLAPQREQIVEKLKEATFDPAIDPQSRSNLADILDQFWQPADLFTFTPIPNPSAPDYLMAKYPVTNAQYERFLTDANFENDALWRDFPQFAEPEKKYKPLEKLGEESWQWLKEAKQNKDNIFENGILYPRYWRDERFGNMHPGAPVVGISWYEANAYCKWLQANWDTLEEGKQGLPKPQEIRLPTEKEWVLAAGGEYSPSSSGRGDRGEGRFAFGELKNPEKEIMQYTNTRESGINRTTPVWMYPQGKSPLDVMDMSGNVLEWQANYYDKDHNYPALRGGSWLNLMVVARVSLRNWNHPSYRYLDLGFRVCVAPHL